MPPIQIIEKRQQNSKTFDLGNGRRQLVVSIGDVHYKDNYADPSEQWKDIDLTWEGNRITKAPYELTHEGSKFTLKNKRTGNITTIEVDSIGGQKIPAIAWERSKGLARISNVALDTDLEVIADFSAVKFRRILKSDKAPQEAKFKVAGDTSMLVVRASDEDGDIPIESSLKDGILTETLKPDRTIEYPVRIDPTWQVGAGTDDATRILGEDFWNLSSVNVSAGGEVDYYQRGIGMRFTNITIPQGATISQAYLTLRSRSTKSATVVNSKISAEDVDDAITFADNKAAFDARFANHTTARVDWDAIPTWTQDEDYNSPEIKSVIQEIVDRGGWNSGQDIVIFWEDYDDRSDHGTACYREGQSYDGSIEFAPKLVIDYTTGVDYPIATSCGLTVSASIDREVAWDRSVNPGLTALATIVRTLAYNRATAPGLTVAVTIVKIFGRLIATNTALAISTTISRKAAFIKSLTPGLTASATVDREVAYNRATQAGLTVAVSIVRTVAWDRAVTAGLTISTTILRIWAISKTITANLAVSTFILFFTKMKRRIATLGTNRVMGIVGTNREVGEAGTNRTIGTVGDNREISTPEENRDREAF